MFYLISNNWLSKKDNENCNVSLPQELFKRTKCTLCFMLLFIFYYHYLVLKNNYSVYINPKYDKKRTPSHECIILMFRHLSGKQEQHVIEISRVFERAIKELSISVSSAWSQTRLHSDEHASEFRMQIAIQPLRVAQEGRFVKLKHPRYTFQK